MSEIRKKIVALNPEGKRSKRASQPRPGKTPEWKIRERAEALRKITAIRELQNNG